MIAMQYLGDVLLATPLLHSLKTHYTEARIDVLVYRNTVAMLEGNPDINYAITTPNRPKFTDYLQLLPQIFRRYDVTITLQTGDRPFLYSVLASPFRVSVVPPKKSTGWWKRYFMQRWLEHDDNDTHTVLQHLKLLDLLEIPRKFSLIPPQIKDAQQLALRLPCLADGSRYVVLHPHPQWTYKRWTIEGWVSISHYLINSGYKLILSGGPADSEKAYIDEIADQLPENVINLAGQVTLAELATIIAGATLFIGPDTGITHLAAATGVPVIALYGPTNPVKWAPWPNNFNQNTNPFHKVGNQQVNNILLCQGEADCVPCHLEGCDRHRQSRSHCLETLAAETIITAINKVLNLSTTSNLQS